MTRPAVNVRWIANAVIHTSLWLTALVVLFVFAA